jgi:hypothetical protein
VASVDPSLTTTTSKSGIVDARERLEAARQPALAVVAAHRDRDARPGAGAGAVPGEAAGDRVERRLGAAPAVDEAEVPVVDVVATAVPLVGPGEDERARAARAHRGGDLPLEDGRLLVLAVAAAVEADLRHHERLVAGLVVQAREVGLERVPVLEVDVEGVEVDERELEVLRRREVDVGDQPAGVLVLRRAVQALEEPLRAPAPVPAGDRSGDLVADRVRQDRRVAGDAADLLADALLDGARRRAVVEERDVLLPRQAGHDEQPVLGGLVEEPPRWRRVGPDRVDAGLAHRPEVAGDHGRGGELGPVGARCEGPVGDPADLQLAVPAVQEASADAGPGRSRRVVGGGVFRHGRTGDPLPLTAIAPFP